MDKVIIVVPSKARANYIAKSTMTWLKFVKSPWFVFVEPQDYEAYSKVVPEDHLINLGENDQGLGFAKIVMKKKAEEMGIKYIFKCDDDVTGWCDKNRGTSKKLEEGAQVLEDALTACVDFLEKEQEIVAVGFPYRWQMWDLSQWGKLNTRLMTCYLTAFDYFHADKDISVFEDVANFIYIRMQNKYTIGYGWAGIDCAKVGANPGGHQVIDRDAKARQELQLMRERIYPGLRFKPSPKKRWKFEPELNDDLIRGRTKKKRG